MDTVYITTGFAWKPETHVDTKHVQLLIGKAHDIYHDHFDTQQLLAENEKYSTYNLEQWNADGGSFCVCPSLEPGVYQFVFRVDNGQEKELKISDYYERTFLGNGRAVNYIELVGYAKVDQSAITSGKRKLIRGKFVAFLLGKIVYPNYTINMLTLLAWELHIDGLQPIPRDSVNNGMAAMLVEQTKEVKEKSFVYVHQHGGDDVT